LDSERAALGSVLLDHSAIVDVMDLVHVQDFYDPRHRLIYGAMLSLYERGIAADAVTVASELNSHCDEAGGAAYLSTLVNTTPTSIHAAQYAEVVAQKAVRRRWITAAGRIAAIAYEDGHDLARDLTRVEAEIAAVSDVPYDAPVPTETWTVRELADMPSAEDEYLISGGILTRGGKLLLYAGSGAGKTTMLDFIVGPLATGKPFLGKYPIDKPHRVLVIQGELSQAEMSSHAQALVSCGYESENLSFARMTDLKLPRGEDRIRRLIDKVKPDVLALDPWYRLFSGESSDKAEQVGVVFDVCDRILEAGSVEAAIIVHHANATGQRTSGSWVFEGWPSTILRLETVAGVESHRILAFEKIRAPSSDLQGERIQIAFGEHGYRLVDTSWTPPPAACEYARLILREAGGQLPRKELLARLMVKADCQLRAANKYLGEAVQEGLLTKVPMGAEMVYQVAEREEY
jgi:hypothetical protein